MSGTVVISVSRFAKLLDNFSCAVKQKQYTRLPYDIWKTLLKITEDDGCLVRISRYCNFVRISNEHRGASISNNDNSFNSYINDYWDDIREKALMNDKEEDLCDKITNSSCTIAPYEDSSDITLIDNIIYDYNNKESENNIMNTFNFDFGPVTNNQVHLSPYGMAIKNSQGTWVAYNGTDVVDVDIFNFDAKKFLYKMPVAIKDIAVGDVVIHNRLPVFVVDVKEGIKVIDVYSGEKKEILLTKNMFGFDFATKVVSVLDFANGKNTATADNPFGSMLPFFLLSNEKDIDPMTLLLLTANNGVMGNSAMDFSNPFMIMALMGDKSNKNDMLLPLLLMNQQKPVPTLPPTSNP